jgi:hypothetical protein
VLVLLVYVLLILVMLYKKMDNISVLLPVPKDTKTEKFVVIMAVNATNNQEFRNAERGAKPIVLIRPI